MRAASSPFSRRCLWLSVLLMLTMWIPAIQAASTIETRVIPLQHRLPDDVIPALRPLLGPSESIQGYDNKLIVRAGPQTLREIERVLGEIDTRRRNLRIRVPQSDVSHAESQDLGASGAWQQGNTRITIDNGGRAQDNRGLNIRRSEKQNQLTIHSDQRSEHSRRMADQSLLVLDGGHATLRVGESIPTIQPYLALAGNRLVVVPGVQFYDVTTGFEVFPRLVGDRVRLQLHPRLAFRSSQGTQTIDFQELQTEVSIRPGEWTDIGGILETANAVNQRILARDQNASGRDKRLLVRVDPL